MSCLPLAADKNQALHLLTCMADGVYSKTPKATPAPSAVQLMLARHKFQERVATAAQQVRSAESGHATSGFDATHPGFYYAAGYMWLQYLSEGCSASAAVVCMRDSLSVIQTQAASISSRVADSSSGRRSLLPPYTWAVTPDVTGAAHTNVSAERCHTALAELLYCAAVSGIPGAPAALRESVIRGLQSFPAHPGLLVLLATGEQHSAFAGRVQHHVEQVSAVELHCVSVRGNDSDDPCDLTYLCDMLFLLACRQYSSVGEETGLVSHCCSSG